MNKENFKIYFIKLLNYFNDEKVKKKLFIEKMICHKDKGIQKGIEGLFGSKFIRKIKTGNSCLKKTLVEEKEVEYEKYEIEQGDKTNIMNWVCYNGKKEDFKGFEHIFELIEKIINGDYGK